MKTFIDPRSKTNKTYTTAHPAAQRAWVKGGLVEVTSEPEVTWEDFAAVDGSEPPVSASVSNLTRRIVTVLKVVTVVVLFGLVGFLYFWTTKQ